ncbi:Calmodulin-binding protein 60 B-like protein [Drosera capensis]
MVSRRKTSEQGKMAEKRRRRERVAVGSSSSEEDGFDDCDEEEVDLWHHRVKRARVCPETYKTDIRSSLEHAVETALDRKIPLLQDLLSKLICDVIRDEVLALAWPGSGGVIGRLPPPTFTKQKYPDGQGLQLRFRTRLSQPIFTDRDIAGVHGAAIQVALLDASTLSVVTSLPGSSMRLNVVVLDGDFNKDDEENWTAEEFDRHIVRERDGRRPLLAGKVQVSLKKGLATFNDLKFTDNSSWIRSKKFRFGVKIASGYCEGIRVREAKTEAFSVRDHRGERYKKHYPPASDDQVWRLENIAKDGKAHKILNQAKINTVEDFRRYFAKDPEGLRNLLSGMPNKKRDALINHAKTCAPTGKVCYFSPDNEGETGVILNNFFELSSLVIDGQYFSVDGLSDHQKDLARTLEKKAYCNWNQIEEYDSHSLRILSCNSSLTAERTARASLQHSPVSVKNSSLSSGPRQSEVS